MAAKPPKPSENFLKQLDDCLSHSNKNNNNQKSSNKVNVSHLSTYEKDNNANGINSTENSNEIFEEFSMNGNNNEISSSSSALKSNCNCTNISIMHLFHEMKQMFPTIPDAIVTQRVNENCHQRENCIKQLQNELALNPIPIQSYPAKVLHPPQRLQSVSKTPITPNAITPITPPVTNFLKPTRPAPVQPPNITVNKLNQSNQKPPGLEFPVNLPQQNVNCDNRSSPIDCNKRNNSKAHEGNRYECIEKDVGTNNICIGDCAKTETQTKLSKASDMPTTTKSFNSISDCVDQNSTTNQIESRENVNLNLELTQNTTTAETPSLVVPRTRPTTLNLQTQFQQQQRQQINNQLQKHFQERSLQQQQNQNITKKEESQSLPLQTKPLRRAPLPPIPPKPAQFACAGSHCSQFKHSNSNDNISPKSNNNVNNNCVLTQSQQSSFSNDSSLTSPTSSIGESELSVNVSLSSPIVAHQPVAAQTSLKSPIRHRSVITVHPEPPYTKDFIGSPTSCVNPTVCTPGQKSFTSVNLTLRQPSINSSIPASTIDISAGPNLSGNSSGLTYSSTSYDARRGYQKNFHITVTDQGGVFSASHIRPHSCFHPDGSNEQNNSSTSPTVTNQLNPLRTVSSEQCVAQKFQQNHIHTSQQEQQSLESLEQQKIVASKNLISTTSNDEDMLERIGQDELTQTLERQKNRRDKMSTALRENKKKLSQLEQEINVLVEPINSEETERLDNEIQKLRCDCGAMLDKIDFIRKCGYPSLSNKSNNNSNKRQQPQPFPRQRQQRPSATQPSSSTTSHSQSQLNFAQHNSSGNRANPGQSSNHEAPPTYDEYYNQCQQGPNLHSTDEEDYTDSPTDPDDDDDEAHWWACNMCTFRNHPQLNVCECCDNVRITPELLLSREDIHITLSPGEKRIIHSWVVS